MSRRRMTHAIPPAGRLKWRWMPHAMHPRAGRLKVALHDACMPCTPGRPLEVVLHDACMPCTLRQASASAAWRRCAT